MPTVMLTMPELEERARQWAVDFLKECRSDPLVVTSVRQLPKGPYDEMDTVLFERTPASVLNAVLSNGGYPWLVSGIVNRTMIGGNWP